MSRLELFVLADCFSCTNALHQAAKAAAYFPTLEVVVTDLSKPNAVVPDIVFATPTFCLDGRIISLGTPEWQTLKRAIQSRVSGTQ